MANLPGRSGETAKVYVLLQPRAAAHEPKLPDAERSANDSKLLIRLRVSLPDCWKDAKARSSGTYRP